MMREELARLYSKKNPKRYSFSARYQAVSCGTRHDVLSKFILVEKVALHQNDCAHPVADHLWVRVPPEFVPLKKMKKGSCITFTGTVEKYKRRRGDMDYGVGNIEELRLAKRAITV